MKVILASAAVIVMAAIAARVQPVRGLKRLAADAEAIGMLLGFAARAAWAERRRWQECRVRARRCW